MAAPIWGLPPDLIVSPIEEMRSMGPPNVWHLPAEVWTSIWNKFRGQGERIAILDTGYTPHNDLPTPIAQKSFVKNQEVRDGNAHGTHCAGTALGRNGIGVAPDAEFLVGKCLSNQGSGSSDKIDDSVKWAIDNGIAKTKELGIEDKVFANFKNEILGQKSKIANILKRLNA